MRYEFQQFLDNLNNRWIQEKSLVDWNKNIILNLTESVEINLKNKYC